MWKQPTLLNVRGQSLNNFCYEKHTCIGKYENTHFALRVLQVASQTQIHAYIHPMIVCVFYISTVPTIYKID